MMYASKKYPYQEETYQLIGIAMDIHNILGKGFLEIVYKDAFELELIKHKIPFEREKKFQINYKGTILKHCFYADFVIDNKIILELKSRKNIVPEHKAQVLNYLAISKMQLGLIMNFHENSLQQSRVILSRN